jgi:4-hydroxybutyryl-CoA dehydratase / vinylacetyl-CoA-Delta-isomerase
MKREIWRNFPVMEKSELVATLLDRGIYPDGRRVSKQPGRCCPTGCQVPGSIASVSPDDDGIATAAE